MAPATFCCAARVPAIALPLPPARVIDDVRDAARFLAFYRCNYWIASAVGRHGLYVLFVVYLRCGRISL